MDVVVKKPARSELGISDHISQRFSPDVVFAIFDSSRCKLDPNLTWECWLIFDSVEQKQSLSGSFLGGARGMDSVVGWLVCSAGMVEFEFLLWYDKIT